MSGVWMSKGPAEGQAPITSYVMREGRQSVQVAHLVEEGRPACAALRRLDGVTPMLSPFKCSWVALRPQDRKCGYCRRLEAGERHLPRAVRGRLGAP